MHEILWNKFYITIQLKEIEVNIRNESIDSKSYWISKMSIFVSYSKYNVFALYYNLKRSTSRLLLSKLELKIAVLSITSVKNNDDRLLYILIDIQTLN